MNRYYVADNYALLQGNTIDVLRELPAESINMCVTSPPYWGLRDYGTAEWEGGDAECGHKAPRQATAEQGEEFRKRGEERGYANGSNFANYGERQTAAGTPYGGTCGKCGARRIDAQLGLEPTPEAYVCAMVEVFREVRRVLRKDGTLWLNLGDSYASGAMSGAKGPNSSTGHNRGQHEGTAWTRKPPDGLKPKDLVGIPWMLAFALRADGWWLRQDIIWSKPNPMPESVTDRCTKAHEYLFLLSKSATYYYDQDAVAEPVERGSAGSFFNTGKTATHQLGRSSDAERGEAATRNKRSVWTIATEPTSEAHFATFPVDLVKPCILAGSAPGGTVLDPFVGSGTAILTAKALGRRGIGIDLNPEYLDIAKRRDEAMMMTRRAVRKNR